MGDKAGAVFYQQNVPASYPVAGRIERMKSFHEDLMVKPGKKVRLSELDPNETHGWSRADADEELERLRQKMYGLQYKLHAESKRSLLIVLQATDTGGKDGTIRNVMSGLNPQGCRVASFKVPSSEELAHDFLWRVHRACPAKGEIGIFNRSHYGDVLVVRVHNIVPKAVWSKRYEQINSFEKILAENGIRILKFFFAYQQGGAGGATARPHRRPGKTLEGVGGGFSGAAILGRLHRGPRGGAVEVQYGVGSVVRDSRKPEVVPESGGSRHRR